MTYTDINGTAGNDTLYGTSGIDYIRGFAGNDTLDGGDGNDSLYGFAGNDTLNGGSGDDYLDGDSGVDTLTGGWGKDSFVFFNNSGSSTVAPNGIRVLNQPDIVTDFQFGEDKLIFGINGANEEDVRTGIVGKGLKFDKGVSSQLSGDENLLVLTDPFPNAAAAAKAIADNNAITSDEGLFVYFNSTLGIARFVHSQDLSDGGSIDVLANLSNVTAPASVNNFSAQDFSYFVLT